jgi:UDP-N-acetylglucosamine 2-epimerase
MKRADKQLDIVTVSGNRPEIIKLSQLVKPLAKRYRSSFLYTGQHYSPNMRDVFLKEFGVEFDHDLQCGTSDISVLRKGVRSYLESERPEYVIVYGDTASTMGAALAAKDVGCKLVHLEAGLRNFNLAYDEERIRVLVDSMSDFFMAPTELNKLFLRYEKIEDQVYVTGNLITDVCRKFSSNTTKLSPSRSLGKYILVTLHKPASIDSVEGLNRLAKFLAKINHDIIFPAHPRTKNSIARHHIRFSGNVTIIDALGYTSFLSLLKNCLLVMTDSGGVQEEAVVLKKPCITLFSTTDRQETILVKANRLYYPLVQEKPIDEVITEMLSVKITTNPYGENVTKRTLEAIDKVLTS